MEKWEVLAETLNLQTPTFKFALLDGLHPMFLPTRAHDTDTGWDIRSRLPISLRAGQYAKIPLGFRIFAPRGWWLELRPRSSSFAKKQLHALYGVIDEAYQDELVFACQYLPDVSSIGTDLQIAVGDAIGQVVPVRREEMIVEQISNEEYDALCKQRNAKRGTGGFGSTGK